MVAYTHARETRAHTHTHAQCLDSWFIWHVGATDRGVFCPPPPRLEFSVILCSGSGRDPGMRARC